MTFSKKPYRIIPLARCVLAKLYVEHVNDSTQSPLTASQVASLFSVDISRNLLLSAITELYGRPYQQDRLVSRSGSKAEGYGYLITQEGIRYVEKALRDKSSDISYFLANGDNALDDVAGLEGIYWTRDELDEIDDWTQITIENDDRLAAAVESVETAILEIEKNNEFESKYPDQKRGLLSAVRSGLDLLKTRTFTRSQLGALLVRPLKWIATTFADSFLGQAAKLAAQKVVDLITSLF